MHENHSQISVNLFTIILLINLYDSDLSLYVIHCLKYVFQHINVQYNNFFALLTNILC